MRRKIFICFFVVLLMTTMVVPAFASSTGGSADVVSSGVIIDYVKVKSGPSSGSVVEWPNNYYASGGNPSAVHTDALSAICEYSGTFDTTIYPGSARSLGLFISDMFWTKDLHFSVDDDGYDSFILSSVTVSGTIYAVSSSKDSGEYQIIPLVFMDEFVVNSSTCNLSKLIRDAVGLDIYTFGDIVYFHNVSITLNFYADSPDVPVGLCFRVSKATAKNNFSAWFASCNLVRTVVYNSTHPQNIFKWLLDAVNAFMEFEIIPGFTLNRLFYIVVVIGLLFWAFKALS